MMEFQPVKAKDQDMINKYFKMADDRRCDMSFASVYMWKGYYPATYTIYDDMLIFKGEGETVSFSFPIGKGDPQNALEAVMDYCKKQEISPAFHCLSRKQAAYLEEKYPGIFTIEFSRDDSEYIYKCEDLMELRGKRYHGKKNHVNKFKKSYDWQYEEIDETNCEECVAMLSDWHEENEDTVDPVEDDGEMNAEVCACRMAVRMKEALGLMGGLIRADGRVVAFTVGEKINSDTIVIHFEKAYADVPGAYSIINQEFLLHHAQDVTYVNREEDMGDLGLRKAKESYHPVFFEENGYACVEQAS